MCGRYMLSEIAWIDYFQALSILPSNAPFEARFNVCPTQTMPILRDEDGLRESPGTWGLRPHWNPKGLLINARLETAATARTFKEAYRARRCLVPATGWWEWTGERPKTPWAITRPEPFFFAGLWFPTDDPAPAYVIVTRAAAPDIAHVHARMPVIAGPEWLAAPPDDPAGYGAAPGGLSAHAVAPFGIRDEGPALLEPPRTLL
ncbi:MAG: SOS response-associated peptidase [Pseudomonadota bacterium]